MSALLLLGGCADPDLEMLQLPSGQTISLEGVENVPVEGDRYYLKFSYVTDTPLAEVNAIEEEAVLVWRSFLQRRADEEGATAAVLLAHNEAKPTFGFFARGNYGTALVKRDGAWIVVNVPNK
ncbi:hypothetical protein HFP89_13845 [Wenzhouxiangella sp. XN79A]|uniref:hypothetical protein n=1 Tax=Wenzhouxiangella sp. XN79A TaxID=2724193 RepID=UPI00144A6C36|nr:hypothetical protein [Wenzhouxiangella sp. XN79A]NKI36248.1 hypothetical protein [Wenzhouxiangella sp. XN79A]